MAKIILQDYKSVAELVKFALKNKHKIDVKRMGDGFSGIYYEVVIAKNPRKGNKKVVK